MFTHIRTISFLNKNITPKYINDPMIISMNVVIIETSNLILIAYITYDIKSPAIIYWYSLFIASLKSIYSLARIVSDIQITASAINEPYVAPKLAYFGINIAFAITLARAPKNKQYVLCNLLPHGTKHWLQSKFESAIIIIIGENTISKYSTG